MRRGLTLSLSVLAALSSSLLSARELPPGEAIERVQVGEQPRQSYALYLPSGYSRDRTWPILYCFEPRARGILAVRLFQEAAEELQYIVAASNNFQSDGVGDPVGPAMAALWNDTHVRFSIDPRRIYSTGFSGGARISWVLAQKTKIPLAGIIGVGAGLPWPEVLDRLDLSSLAYYGIAGETDFNYFEMKALDGKLADLGMRRRFDSFQGGHAWPPKALCRRALMWMELQAMRDQRRAPDTDWIERLLRRDLDRAQAAESGGDLVRAHDLLAALVRDFEGLADTGQARQSYHRLKDSRLVKKRLKKQKKELRSSQTYERRLLPGVLRSVKTATPMPSLEQLASDLRLRFLLGKAKREDRDESLAAQRILETIFVHAAYYVPRELKQRGDFARASLSLKLAARIKPDNAFVWLRAAQVFSLAGKRSSALKAIRKAIENGFNRPGLLENDPELAAVRSKPEFQDLLRELKKK